MGGAPRKKFRERPKKSGAQRKVRVNAQKKRLLKAGMAEDVVAKMSATETRQAQKKVLAGKQ